MGNQFKHFYLNSQYALFRSVAIFVYKCYRSISIGLFLLTKNIVTDMTPLFVHTCLHCLSNAVAKNRPSFVPAVSQSSFCFVFPPGAYIYKSFCPLSIEKKSKNYPSEKPGLRVKSIFHGSGFSPSKKRFGSDLSKNRIRNMIKSRIPISGSVFWIRIQHEFCFQNQKKIVQ